MMKISRENYEQWLIDYMEGNLAPHMAVEVRRFLEDHPDIAEELDGLDEIGLVPVNKDVFPAKEMLFTATSGLPALSEESLDIWLIARLEGDLDSQQLEQLDAWLLSNPDSIKDARLFDLTRLQADTTVTMPSRASLKRTFTQTVIHDDTIGDWLIARLEGETNPQEDKAIAAYIIDHPEAAREEKLIRQSRLQADMSVMYPGKDSLRRFVIPIVNQRTGKRFLALAASVIIIIGLFLGMPSKDSTPYGPIQLASTSMDMPSVPAVRVSSPTGPGEMQQAHIDRLTSLVIPATPGPDRVERFLAAGSVQYLNASSSDIQPRHMTAVPELVIPENSPELLTAGSRTYTLKEYAALKLRRFTYGDDEPVNADPRIDRWEVADAGVTGFNKLTGSNVRFEREVDTEGKLNSFMFGTDRYHFARN